MNSFSRAFATSDRAVLKAMGETLLAWRSGSDQIEITGSPSPVEAGSTFRTGGQAQTLSLEFEVSRETVKANAIEEGWKIRWEERDYLVTSTVYQGSTVTLQCSSLGDASV